MCSLANNYLQTIQGGKEWNGAESKTIVLEASEFNWRKGIVSIDLLSETKREIQDDSI